MEIKEILMFVGIYIFGFISLSSCISIGVKIGLTAFLQEKQLKLENKQYQTLYKGFGQFDSADRAYWWFVVNPL